MSRFMLWGPEMQPIPSNDQRAELPDIILGGRDLLNPPQVDLGLTDPGLPGMFKVH